MRKSIQFPIICLCISMTMGAMQVPQPSVEDQASAILLICKAYLRAGDYTAAEKKLLEAIAIASSNSQVRREAVAIFHIVLEEKKKEENAAVEIARGKYRALLQEVNELSSEGKFDQASTLIQKIMDETKDPELIKEAKDSLTKVHPDWLKRLYIRFIETGWLLDFILVLLILTIFYWLLRLLRFVRGWFSRKKWAVINIVDNSGWGVGESVVAFLQNWADIMKATPACAGLLKYEMPWLPTVPRLDVRQLELDFSQALESLHLQIGNVDIGAIGRGLAMVRKWLSISSPWIRGSVCKSEKHVVVSLAQRSFNGKICTITVMREIDQGINAAMLAAEEASFKMYYLIASNSSISKAEAAEKLRKGLGQLRKYVFGENPNGLQAALNNFRLARNEYPALDEAYLYEGITLDLMEHHDEAIRLFQYLVQSASNKELREKAAYNEAISRFRKYKYDELDPAIEKLKNLIGENLNFGDFAASPIRALALAAKMNVIAHKPIFWQQLLFGGTKSVDESDIRKRKEIAKEEVKEWINTVEGLSKDLGTIYGMIARHEDVWEDVTKRQLQWAIQNAMGNAFMNYAKYFLDPPYLDEPTETKLQMDYLEKAFSAFKQCELLLPPGVETLTNLATILLNLSRTAESRCYAQRAIDLNPDYEYAYYRCAQSWEKDNRKDKVIEILKSFAKTKIPHISGFIELYRKYAIELVQQ